MRKMLKYFQEEYFFYDFKKTKKFNVNPKKEQLLNRI